MNNYTIIIPTHNRPAHLKRILSYYDGLKEDSKIVVSDSSSEDNKRQNENIVLSVTNLSIRYLDYFTPDMHPLNKFYETLQYVDTEYCVFCADDDFIVPDGIKKSVEFLENNREYVIAQGRYISFKVTGDKKNKRKFHWNFAAERLSIEFENPADRFERQLSKYFMPTFYGVHRSDVLKAVFDEVLKSGVDPYLYMELLATSLTLIFGKMKYVDVFYAARSEQTGGSGSGWPSIKDAVTDGTYNEKYARFRDCLVMHLVSKAGLNSEESGEVVDRAMAAYMKKYISAETLGLPKSRKRAFLDSLHLPDQIYNRIFRLYLALRASIRPIFLFSTWVSRPVYLLSGHSKEIGRIRQCVLLHSVATLSEHTI